MDFATRYPQAVSLKNIDTETVSEALVNIFCRLGVPGEILSNLGTKFVSDCMKAVTCMLCIKQLNTSHVQWPFREVQRHTDGHVETPMQRATKKKWHCYINPLLFAYREVPHESTGFATFDLLYG